MTDFSLGGHRLAITAFRVSSVFRKDFIQRPTRGWFRRIVVLPSKWDGSPPKFGQILRMTSPPHQESGEWWGTKLVRLSEGGGAAGRQCTKQLWGFQEGGPGAPWVYTHRQGRCGLHTGARREISQTLAQMRTDNKERGEGQGFNTIRSQTPGNRARFFIIRSCLLEL